MALPENINTLEKAKFLEFLGETAIKVVVVNQQNFIKNYGSKNISIGETTIDIIFSTEMSDTNYCAIVTIENNTSNPIFLNPVVIGKYTDKVSVLFNAPTDSNDYVINYAILG